MPMWQKIIYLILMLGLCWWIYQSVRRNPEWLSRENLGKSFSSMGVLALILIAFVALLIFMLR